jgi:branched-chain amino acid transport system permease protein
MDHMEAATKRFWLIGLLLFVFLLLVAFPFYASTYPVIFLTNILMYVVVTLSWVIFSGPTGYISLAPAAFFGLGVYASAILSKSWSLPIVMFVGGFASFCLAFLVGSLTLRLKGMYFTMFTFGLVMLISHFVQWWEVNITGTVGRLVIALDETTIYYAMLIVFLLVLLASYLIRRSKFGLALQSIGECEEAAAHTGVNVTRVKVVTFGVSAFFMGLAGATMAMRWQYIDPSNAFDIRLSFLPVLMAIFGGAGQLYGPIVGASLFSFLDELLTTKFPYYYMLLFGATMMVVILLMPFGIEGVIQRWQKKEKKGLTEKI